MPPDTPKQEYDRLVRNLERDLFPPTEHHHAALQMLCYHDDRELLDYICAVMPDSIRYGFRMFVSEIGDNGYYYNVRSCFEDRRSSFQLHDEALVRQPILRRLIPLLLESI